MKKLSILFVLFISANLYAEDMLEEIVGKWHIDIEATKKLPDVIEILKDPKKAQRFNMMMGILGKSEFEFTKDSLIQHFEMPGPDGKKVKSQMTKFTVIENKKDHLIIEDDKKSKLIIKRSGDNIILIPADEEDKKRGAGSLALKPA